MTLILLLAMLQGQAINQPGDVTYLPAKPATLYYERYADGSFDYILGVQSHHRWKYVIHMNPEPVSDETPIVVREEMTWNADTRLWELPTVTAKTQK